MKSKQLFAALGELDDRFIAEDASQPAPKAGGARLLRYLPAACAAALCLLVWGLSRLPAAPDQTAHLPAVSPPDTAPADEPEPATVDALVLNRVDAQLAADRYIEGHFWYDLTDAQRDAVFPDLPISVLATAHYRGDGTLYNVVASEWTDSGDRATYREHYTATMIEVIGPGGDSMQDVVYEYEPLVSDVQGVPVVAGVFDFTPRDGVALYLAKFTAGEVTYWIELYDDDAGDSGHNRLTALVNAILCAAPADLDGLRDPVIPPLRDERLTLAQARSDPDFGAFLPKTVPGRFTFDSAHRMLNQTQDALSAFWYSGYNDLHWRVSQATDEDRARIVSADEREKFDLSLYPIPRADSVPAALRDVVDTPVFRAEEFTLDLLKARAYFVDSDKGDTPSWRMHFSVLYDDIVVTITAKGATPEQVWAMLVEIAP